MSQCGWVFGFPRTRLPWLAGAAIGIVAFLHAQSPPPHPTKELLPQLRPLFERLGTINREPELLARQPIDNRFSIVVARAPLWPKDRPTPAPHFASHEHAMAAVVLEGDRPDPLFVIDVVALPRDRYPATAIVRPISPNEVEVVLRGWRAGENDIYAARYRFDLGVPAVTSRSRDLDFTVRAVATYRGRLYAAVTDPYDRQLVMVLDPTQADVAPGSTVLAQIAGSPILPVEGIEERGECLVLSGGKGGYTLCGDHWAAATADDLNRATVPLDAGDRRRVWPEWVQKAAEAGLLLDVSEGGVRRLLFAGDLRDDDRNRVHAPDWAPGIYEVTDDRLCFVAMPQTDWDTYRRLKPAAVPEDEQDRYRPDLLGEGIAALQLVGGSLWFGLGYYSGEGSDGVGGFGRYDVAARRFEIRHPVELADWSTTAILVDGDTIWLGLASFGEYGGPAGGVAGFSRAGTCLARLLVPGHVSILLRVGARVVIGTSEALCAHDGGGTACWQLRESSDGRLTVAKTPPERMRAYLRPGDWEGI